MKTTFKMLMALGAVAMLTACGGGSSSSDENQTATPAAPVTQETETTTTTATTCKMGQIAPTGYGIITLKVKCTGAVDTATVTLDSVVQNVDFRNGGILYFYNVQPSTTYVAELNVIANGEPLAPVIVRAKTGSYETPPAPAPEPEPEPTPEARANSRSYPNSTASL